MDLHEQYLSEFKLEHTETFKYLLSLNLPRKDWAIYGSGPLIVRGVRTFSHDLDIIARSEAWDMICKLGKTEIPSSGNGLCVKAFDGKLEFYNKWLTDEYDVDSLIDQADVIGGVRYVKCEEVIKYKEELHRKKDLKDIDAVTTIASLYS